MTATAHSDRAALPSANVAAVPGASTATEHIHPINIEHLIVHKYQPHEALIRKADTVAREIIHNELRPGEFLHVAAPGRYNLVLPKLRPDAGSLRCSVITEILYRAIKELNPAAKDVASPEPGQSQPTRGAPLGSITRREPAARPRAIAKPDQTLTDHDKEMRRAASQAIELMCKNIATKSEELLSTPAALGLIQRIKVKFQPVWNVKAHAITAYLASPMDGNRPVAAARLPGEFGFFSTDEATAVLDAVVYRHACQHLTSLIGIGEQALVVVPVHFSTVDHSRFVGAYLDAGSDGARASKDRIVFQLRGVPPNLSRYRLQEAAAYLKGRARALNAFVNPLEPGIDFKSLKAAGILGVGIEVEQLPTNEARLMALFEKFIQICERSGVYASVKDVSSLSMLSAAMAAGFSYICGPAVAPALEHPRGVIPYDAAAMFNFTSRKWEHSGT
ncbi:MAG: hypothetical protein SFV21_17200 [Rhodospirillaceae bacterium]|nr:hypothetical protein [Rhodospirillaceae bacterium]